MITYDEFEKVCKNWDFTVDMGFEAMCFIGTLLSKNYENNEEYFERVSADKRNSGAVIHIAECRANNALVMLQNYNDLTLSVFDKIEAYRDANN